MPFHPVEPVRAYQQIAEQIERAVVSGEFKPGDRLPSERELVEQFQVGRSSVREALRVLESSDLVRSRLGDPRGPQVMPVSVRPLRKTLARFASVERGNFAALVQFRMIVEGAANLLAAQYRTDEHLSAMERVNARMRAALGADLDQFSQADFEFHQAVARASGNPLLEVCGDAVRETVLALMRTKLADVTDHHSQMRNSVHHHEQVLSAIREQDGSKAARLARERLYEYYRGYVDEQDQPGLRALLTSSPA